MQLRVAGSTLGGMNGIQIGYARVSTADQDLTSQRESLLRLEVLDSNIYVDHGLTGTNRARPGLREALAAVREGDTLVVTKLDRLARSVRDARDIADELTTKGVALSLAGSRYDPTDPVGRLLFNVLAMVAEFERDLISMRTRASPPMSSPLSTPAPRASTNHGHPASGSLSSDCRSQPTPGGLSV